MENMTEQEIINRLEQEEREILASALTISNEGMLYTIKLRDELATAKR